MFSRGDTLRENLGVLLFDMPLYLVHMMRPGGWANIGNRNDSLEIGPGKQGIRCKGRWSSDLHACHVFPSIGKKLLRAALREWPIHLDGPGSSAQNPDISFVIPHRGVERQPLLLHTIRSILVQREVAVECIVVEQSQAKQIDGLPEGVRHIHLPHPEDPAGWHKSWAYNKGVEAARADIVVCHDGDILVPADYAREILKFIRSEDYEVVHLQRFLFCLNQQDTDRLIETNRLEDAYRPERVRQNWQGGTLAIRKDAFFQVGGYDERFVGWGGEDNEFFDRCQTLRSWRYGYLPFIHLWHPPQTEKVENSARGKAFSMLDERLSIEPLRRIQELREQSTVRRQDVG